MKFLILASACLAVAVPAAARADSLSPPAIEARIVRDGAVAVVNQLNAGSGDSWNMVIAAISSGQAAWLAVAQGLAPGADAGSGEDLETALSTALPKNPAGVLDLTGKTFPIADICSVPLIEPTDQQVAAWRHTVLAALAKVNDAAMAPRLQACRAAISANN
jgi:hypothetical protein